MPRRKPPTVRDELLDQLLAGSDPRAALADGGLLDGLKKALAERALVLCVDEKSQIQALDRSQPLLPMRPGQVERRTHDYPRHGTTSLFAALDVATGAVIGRCYPKHRSREFRKFLDQIEAAVPSDWDCPALMDGWGPG